MRISDWSSDVCSSDLQDRAENDRVTHFAAGFIDHAQRMPRLWQLAVFFQTAKDVLDVHDGIVHQFANGDRQPSQCHRFDRHAQPLEQIGKASCRESVCQYVYISVVAVSLTKKK